LILNFGKGIKSGFDYRLTKDEKIKALTLLKNIIIADFINYCLIEIEMLNGCRIGVAPKQSAGIAYSRNNCC